MLKGYRLHDQRLAYSAGTGSMRTIKFELVDTAEATGVRDKVAAAISSDYFGMYGPLTVADHLALNKGATFSMLGFWLLCQRVGIFFGKNEASVDGAFAAYKGKKIGWFAAYAHMPQQLRSVFDEEAWALFMSAEQRALDKKTPDARARIIRGLARKDTGTEAIAKYLEPVASRYADGITTAPDKLTFKCELFGVQNVQTSHKEHTVTWVIDPDARQIDANTVPTLTIEETMTRYRQNGLDENQLVAAMGIGNNGNYLNNIFGTAADYLRDGKAEALVEEMAKIHGFSDTQRKVAIGRLETLAEYLRHLGKPRMTNRWAEYRGDFNGSLESWFSNRAGKHNEQNAQLTAMSIQCLALEKMPDIGGVVVAISQELRATIEDGLQNGTVSQDVSEVLRILQGELRTAINDWRQSAAGQQVDAKALKEINKVLGKNLQSTPQFFGVTQAARYARLRSAKTSALTQIELLQALWVMLFDACDQSQQLTDRTVDALARTYLRCESPKVRDVYLALQSKLGCDFAARDDKHRYYISGYERREGIAHLERKALTVGEMIAAVNPVGILVHARDGIVERNTLRDTVELLKTVFAAVLGTATDGTVYDISPVQQLLSERQKLLAVRGGDPVLNNVGMRLLSMLTFSELGGFVAIISREFFVVRAAVQATNGQQMVLGYTTHTKSGNDYRRYYVCAKDINSEIGATPTSLYLACKSYNYEPSDFVSSECKSDKLLAIRSSRYQVQFIEWLLGYNKKKRSALRAGGSFSIVERDATIDWSGDVPKLSFKGTPRVYISQPFTIIPPERVEQLGAGTRYMGVDIGEYGLAWAVIDADGAKADIVASGFLTDGQHRMLASRVRQLRERQTRATFTMPSTRVARLRESLTGAYRARLEALSMKYRARLSFEYEVSAFETGGARIAKIYDSIKRADVLKKDNNPQNKQAWGKATKDAHTWAYETTAAGTSQTCSKCKRWVKHYITDTEKYGLRAHTISGLSVARLDNGEDAVCFAPKAQELTGSELKKAIYKAMRPNQEGIAMGLIDTTTRRIIDTEWRRQRGNIALFICPFTNCQHVSDADIQAAFNIAMRGYIKHQYRDQKEAKLSEEFFYEITKNMDYRPISLT